MSLTSGNLTLQDWANRTDGTGIRIENRIAELLIERNPILQSMVWVESNQPTSHKSVIRTGLPEVYWRMINRGIPPSKSRTASVVDTIGMLEALSPVDIDLAKLNGNTAEFRLTEDSAFLDAMNIEMASNVFYGNTLVDPTAILGLTPRFNTLDVAKAASAENVLDAGGVGADNTSIWLIGWSDNTVFGIFPKGSRMGLMAEDQGKQLVYDDENNAYFAYLTHYKWDAGMVVKNWKYAVRIANIDVSELTSDASSGAKLIDLMIKAYHKLESMNGVKASFYANRTIATFLHLQATNKDNVNLTIENFAGRRIPAFLGIPIETCEGILDTEAAVTA